MSIPNDILFVIFSHLPLYTIEAYSLVCKQWDYVIKKILQDHLLKKYPDVEGSFKDKMLQLKTGYNLRQLMLDEFREDKKYKVITIEYKTSVKNHSKPTFFLQAGIVYVLLENKISTIHLKTRENTGTKKLTFSLDMFYPPRDNLPDIQSYDFYFDAHVSSQYQVIGKKKHVFLKHKKENLDLNLISLFNFGTQSLTFISSDPVLYYTEHVAILIRGKNIDVVDIDTKKLIHSFNIETLKSIKTSDFKYDILLVSDGYSILAFDIGNRKKLFEKNIKHPSTSILQLKIISNEQCVVKQQDQENNTKLYLHYFKNENAITCLDFDLQKLFRVDDLNQLIDSSVDKLIPIHASSNKVQFIKAHLDQSENLKSLIFDDHLLVYRKSTLSILDMHSLKLIKTCKIVSEEGSIEHLIDLGLTGFFLIKSDTTAYLLDLHTGDFKEVKEIFNIINLKYDFSNYNFVKLIESNYLVKCNFEEIIEIFNKENRVNLFFEVLNLADADQV